MPVAAAIDRVDQCASAPGPGSSTVLVTTSSTCSSVIVRGAPGRGSSDKPSRREAWNRDRHLRTVSRDTFRPAATAVTDAPSAQASTIRERCASAWDVLRRCSVLRRPCPVIRYIQLACPNVATPCGRATRCTPGNAHGRAWIHPLANANASSLRQVE